MLGAAESVLLPCCVLTVLTPPDQPCAPAGCVLPAVLAHRAPGSLPSSMPGLPGANHSSQALRYACGRYQV